MRLALLHNAVPPDAPPDEADTLVQVEAVRAVLASLGHEALSLACDLNLASLAERLSVLRPDGVFYLVEALAGKGNLIHLPASVLDAIGLPYTGAPAEALFLTSGKLLAKAFLCTAGLPTPPWWRLDPADPRRVLRRDGGALPAGSGDRYIIKPAWEHGSLSMDDDAVVECAEADLADRIAERAARLKAECFAERFIEGREFNLALLAGPEGPRVLPPGEMLFEGFPPEKPRIVNYRAKWDDRSFEYHHTPRRFDLPPEDAPLVEELRRLALACWHLFGLRGYARVDFRVDPAGRPWILEVNANPCIAPEAGYSAALERAGISYTEAIQAILADGGITARRAAQPEAVSVGGRAEFRDLVLREEVSPEDRERVRAMAASTGFFSPAEVRIAVELVDDRLRRGAGSDYRFLLAERHGEVVGYVCYGLIDGTASSYDIYWIVVPATWQRRGLGRVLLAETERRIAALGGTRIYVDTAGRELYAPTRAFYEAAGYRRAAVIADFYGPGDDKVIYEKKLAPG